MAFPTIFTTVFIYMKSSYNLQHEINSYQLHSLENVKNETNELLNNIETISVQYAMDSTVNFFLSNDFSADRLASKRLYDNITNSILINKYINSIYIYFSQSGLVMAPSGIYKVKDFYDQGFVNAIAENKNMFIMPPRKILNKNVSTEQYNTCVSYIRGLPLTNPYHNTGTLVININYEEIEKRLKRAVSGDRDIIFIINGNGEIISSSKEEYLKRNLNDILGRNMNTLQGTGYILEDFQKAKMMVSYTEPSSLGWRFVQITPLEVINRNITFIKNLTISVVAVTIFLGLIIVLLLSYRMYSPIAFLISEARKIRNDNSLVDFQGISKNEIDTLHKDLEIISQSMLEEKNEKHILINQVNETRNAVISKFFQNLIIGSDANGKDFTQRLISLGWAAQDYIVMIISMDGYDAFKTKWSEADQALWKFALVNIVDEVINLRHKGIVFENAENQWVAIINISVNDENKAGSEAYCVGNEIHSTIKQYCSVFTVTIAIGSYAGELSTIYVAFEDAKTAFQHKWMRGGNAVYLYNSLDNTKQPYAACMEEEKEILCSLKQNNLEMATKHLKMFIKEMNIKNNGCGKNIYHGMLLLSVSILKMLQETGYSMEDIFSSLSDKRSDLLTQFRALETLEEVEKWLIDIFRAITDFLWQMRNSKNDSVMSDILSYINQNYEKDIYLPFLADKFGMSESLVSRNFKQYAGECFTEYINRLRIEKSKLLLKESCMNLNEISGKIGYSNIQTFIRTFKKLEGITPGQYREDALNMNLSKKN